MKFILLRFEFISRLSASRGSVLDIVYCKIIDIEIMHQQLYNHRPITFNGNGKSFSSIILFPRRNHSKSLTTRRHYHPRRIPNCQLDFKFSQTLPAHRFINLRTVLLLFSPVSWPSSFRNILPKNRPSHLCLHHNFARRFVFFFSPTPDMKFRGETRFVVARG